MSGERVETPTCVGEVVDVQYDLRDVPIEELQQYTAEELEGFAGNTIALLKLRVFEELGAYKGDGDREDNRVECMRHIKPTDCFSWVPAEEVLRVITVLHADDVKLGEFWFASSMVDVAVVTVGKSKDWVMLPETAPDFEESLVMSYTARMWSMRLHLRLLACTAVSDQDSFTATAIGGCASDEFLFHILPSVIYTSIYLHNRKSENAAS